MQSKLQFILGLWTNVSVNCKAGISTGNYVGILNPKLCARWARAGDLHGKVEVVAGDLCVGGKSQGGRERGCIC